MGTGLAGSTAASAMVLRGVARESILVDIHKTRAQPEADDLFHTVPFAHPAQVRAGEHRDLAGSQVVILAAGVSMRPGEDRLQLQRCNVSNFRDIVPHILAHAADALLVVATNPLGVMTHLAVRAAGRSETGK